MSVNQKRLNFFGVARQVLAFVMICALVFVVGEGLSSTTVAVVQMMRKPPLSAPSVYDETLGWTSIPNTFVPNMYGPGKYVRTNSQGFRNDDETTAQVPQGKLRIICSGDSFTYGQGVANNRSWCHRLSELDSRIEVINLGQPGYGVDQIYLRYLSDGIALQHSIHIFAFVGGDLDRMSRLDQHLHGKPVLKLDGGELVTDNVPVPRFKWSVSRVLERAEFRSVGLAQRLLARLSPRNATPPNVIDSVGPVAIQVFKNVQQWSGDNDVVPVFVFLPTENNIGTDTSWHRWVKANMATLELPFVDLTPSLRSLPAPRLSTFFIPESMPATGHYTEAGNEWVAERLYNYLMQIPHVQASLAATGT